MHEAVRYIDSHEYRNRYTRTHGLTLPASDHLCSPFSDTFDQIPSLPRLVFLVEQLLRRISDQLDQI